MSDQLEERRAHLATQKRQRDALFALASSHNGPHGTLIRGIAAHTGETIDRAAEKAEQRAVEESERTIKENARRAYMQAGGTLAQFEADWPGIRRQAAQERAAQAMRDEPKPAASGAQRYLRAAYRTP